MRWHRHPDAHGRSERPLDEWTDVTPAGGSLTSSDFDNDNYGAQDVLVDPVRASKFVYAQSGGATAGGTDQSQSERGVLPDGTEWTTWPVSVSNGPKRAAVTNDGTHYIVVGGNWLEGVYRYVEP
jgi:hypothetical protein